jgi:hypothetical protein
MFLNSSKNETYFRKCCRGKQNIFYIRLRFHDNRALYETIWKHAVQPDIPQMTILGRMRIACSITKVTLTHTHTHTHTHKEYAIFNAFQLRQ